MTLSYIVYNTYHSPISYIIMVFFILFTRYRKISNKWSPISTQKNITLYVYSEYMRQVIKGSYLSKWSHTYDMIQYKQQGINYVNWLYYLPVLQAM